jgi:hypothetical protein
MPTNLTSTKIKDTFVQLLHIDGGPEAAPKAVRSATGTETALKLGTGSVEVDNVRIDGNVISTTNTDGNLELTPNGTGSVAISKVSFADAAQARTALGLGSAALDDMGDFATAAQGQLADTAVQPGDLGTAALAATTDFATAAQGLLADTALQPGDPISVAFGNVTGRAYGIFYDLSDQTFAADTPTLIEFDTTGLAVGVTVASSTRITFAAAGVYEIACRLQFINAENTDHSVGVWFRLNGTDIPYSASELVVPQSSAGGTAVHAITGILQVTAGQYLEVVVAAEDADVSLHHVAPLTTPYARPDIPSVILVANRIA